MVMIKMSFLILDNLTYANYESDMRKFFGIAAGSCNWKKKRNDYDADDITAYNIFGTLDLVHLSWKLNT